MFSEGGIFFSRGLLLIMSSFWVFSSLGYGETEKKNKSYLPTASLEITKENADHVDFEADQLVFENLTQTVKGKGRVLVQYGKRLLHADEIVYDQQKDQLYALGNVWMRDASGEIVFAQKVDLHDKFSLGEIREIKVLLTDESRLAAREAVRYHPKKVLFQNAVYSPCKVCKGKSIFWQLKAKKVLHNQENQTIEYQEMQMEILEVPVLYLPYFRHPDATVERKTGLVRPSYGRSKDLGFILRLPAYYAIGPDQDLTLEPIIMTNQWPLLHTTYRRNTPNGEFILDGSYTYSSSLKSRLPKKTLSSMDNPSPNRWHVFLNGRYEMSRTDLFTYDLRRTSDLTYLRRYPVRTVEPDFAQVKNLTSNIRYEKFLTRGYGKVEGYSFQTDNGSTTPHIFPLGHYEYTTLPTLYGGELYIIGNALSLSRRTPRPTQSAKNMNRLSLIVGWEKSIVTSHGEVWTTNISQQSDGYIIHGFRPSPLAPQPRSYFRGRLSPQLSVQWKYPLVQSFKKYSWVFEPKVKVFASPGGGDSLAYPNEDSGLFVLEHTHAFINRFDGLDRLDNGIRTVWGVNNVLFLPYQRRVKLFIGKTLRMTRRQVLPMGSGEDKVGSDWLINFQSDIADWLKADYTATLNRKEFKPRLSQTRIQLGPDLISLNISHVYLSKVATVNKKRLSQINWEIRSHPVDCWYVSLSQSRDLTSSGSSSNLASLGAIKYENDCAQITLGFYKSNYKDRDIRPDSGFLLKIALKHLGSLSPTSSGNYPKHLLGRSWF